MEKAYPELTIKLEHVTTKGDRILDAPLAKIGGKGLFTKELEEGLLTGQFDLAVHSLKDMPTQLPAGLTLAAITKREAIQDAFVSVRYANWQALPPGAKVGTSSLRRKAQLLALRPDLQVLDLRGNVGTRVHKLEAGAYDAIVLAAAGLERLGLSNYIRARFAPTEMLPAVGQGALAVETRANDERINSFLAVLNDMPTRQATIAERAFMQRVEGGCQVPVGAFAEVHGENLHMTAVIASLDGKRVFKGEKTGQVTEAQAMGIHLAEQLLEAGAREVLQEIGLLTAEK